MAMKPLEHGLPAISGSKADRNAARTIITEGIVRWGAARVSLDQNTFQNMLAEDFSARLPDRTLSRIEFIDRCNHYPYGRVTRFDPSVLTVEKVNDLWVAVILEKLEYDQTLPGGATRKGYTLAVTRDGWKDFDGKWKVVFTELVSAEMWRDEGPPPLEGW